MHEGEERREDRARRLGDARTLSARGLELPASVEAVAETLPGPLHATSGDRAVGDLVEQLGAYQLERRVGAGGMGEVFAARHVDSGERVALKRIAAADATRLVRFKREFRALADLRHPNLVRLGELVVEAEGAAFFTMELVEGLPFDHYVRRRTPVGEAPNLARLERVLAQLIAGLAHLHERGFLHRDLKPANVLVTLDGRVVILDFGLIAEIDQAEPAITNEGQLLGTPAYMAPEQCAGVGIGAAADVYALGVMLFQCLCGRLPFGGSVVELIMRKLEDQAPDPRTHAEGVPDELAAQCMALMARDPAARPTSAALRGRDTGADADRSWRPRRRTPAFVGRGPELAALDDALDAVQRERRGLCVHLHGVSGLGKSRLLAHFAARAKADDERLLVLRGRCYERESVPFEGVDAVIDALSSYLRRLPEVERARFEPRRASALIKLFPVLADLWAARGRPPLGDPTLLRRQAIVALREVLDRIADERGLIVVVDDFQWANHDGARLLGALMREPDAPAMLLVVAFREEAREGELVRALVDSGEAGEGSEGHRLVELALAPLTTEEAATLARSLGADADELDQRVEQAGGNPFYLAQLSRAPREGEATGGSTSSLDRLIAGQILALRRAARRLLALVALAGGRLPTSVLAELDARPHAALTELHERGLMTEFDARIEARHDRIREVMIAELDGGERAVLHLRLAEALEAHGAPAEALAEHYERGGERGVAALHYAEAARLAGEQLGFARAVALYRRALELLPEAGLADGVARGRELREALAEQLVADQRVREAATSLGELADELVEARGPDRERALALRARAAELWMIAGEFDRGRERAAPVLAQLCVPPPRPRESALRLVLARLRLRLRGLAPGSRAVQGPVSADEALDLLMPIFRGELAYLSPYFVILHGRMLGMALDLGEDEHLSPLLAMEAVIAGMSGRAGRAAELVERSRALASDDEVGLAYVDYVEGAMCYETCDHERALASFAHFNPAVFERSDFWWLRAFVNYLVGWSRFELGRWREHQREHRRFLAEFGDRIDALEYAVNANAALRIALVLGEADDAARMLARAKAASSRGGASFLGELQVALFEGALVLVRGDARAALAQLDAVLERARRAGGPLMYFGARLHYEHYAGACCRVLLAGEPTPGERRRLRRKLRTIARHQRGAPMPFVQGEAALNRAALRAEVGDREGTIRWLRRAEATFADHQLAGALAMTRWRLAERVPAAEAEALWAEAERFLSAQEVADPEGVLACQLALARLTGPRPGAA